MAWRDTELFRVIETLLRPDLLIERDSVERAPGWSGAYLLIIQLDEVALFERGREVLVFDPGCYAYAGSAYGPGGVGARLRRHFRREKKTHWHVDHLTKVSDLFSAAVLRDGSECAIVSRLLASGAFRPSLEGFGSSDCRACRSHLLEWCA